MSEEDTPKYTGKRLPSPATRSTARLTTPRNNTTDTTQNALADAQLHHLLEQQILNTARAVYSFPGDSQLAVLMQTDSDGDPFAQLVLYGTPNTLVLIEESGISRHDALQNLLSMMENCWSAVCELNVGDKGGSPYYIEESITLSEAGQVVTEDTWSEDDEFSVFQKR
ncbi:hypothetical protein BDV95DRAFT_609375 [Massariosphaeria phaeospora]|uniref:Uncharacterized protein n=1 Tax=Massariosphaeria phaeospora TaxID=100035 RepID=A0A7C8M5F1_9PLEO|nr:hypothetical protein BDV95DRAFT_609375 [Massariosphaeria phaeospora]